MTEKDKLAYTRHEAAEALGLSLETIDKLTNRGELVSFKVGRSRRYPADQLRNFVSERVAASA